MRTFLECFGAGTIVVCASEAARHLCGGWAGSFTLVLGFCCGVAYFAWIDSRRNGRGR